MTNSGELDEEAQTLLRLTHKTIKAVTYDLQPDRYVFNTSIARCMELLNGLYKFVGDKKTAGKTSNGNSGHEPAEKMSHLDKQLVSYCVRSLLLLLAPMAPHITEELWHTLKFAKSETDSIHTQTWPEFEESLTFDDEIELVLQINGKIVSKLLVQRGIEASQAEALALKDEKMQNKINAQVVRKVIVVRDKLVNVVI
jgi:leucyl-tRNA synthetase